MGVVFCFVCECGFVYLGVIFVGFYMCCEVFFVVWVVVVDYVLEFVLVDCVVVVVVMCFVLF